jgi:Protein of unknown function (DUF1570)
MRRWFLASALLLGIASLARADYLLLIVNLNGKPPAPPGTAGRPGVPTGPIAGIPGLGGRPEPEDVDPDGLVVTILEVDTLKEALRSIFQSGRAPVLFTHAWGKGNLVTKTSSGSHVLLLTAPEGRSIPPVWRRYRTAEAELLKTEGTEKPSAKQYVNLARWALQHHDLHHCAENLDKAAELDKNNPVVANYIKVKAELDRPLPKENPGSDLISTGKLLQGFKVAQTDTHHYAVLHNLPSDSLAEKHGPLDRLEEGFRAYYLWWAFQGFALPVPKTRLLAVVCDSARSDDFVRLQKTLGGDATVAGSFFARRENLPIFLSKRNDPTYTKLSVAASEQIEQHDHQYLLTGKRSKPLKQDLMSKIEQLKLSQTEDEARVRALSLKTLEVEWEKTSTSHLTGRQMLFASGELPSNVNVPEWIQFGMGSFFETPLQSAWGGVGVPSPYWLPKYKEFTKLGVFKRDTALATLKRVVTDGYFRHISSSEDSEFTTKGETASWSLAYYLATQRTEGLHRYFQELSKMPRDMELDDDVLLECFCRAFNCMVNGKIDEKELARIAVGWHEVINGSQLKDPGEEALYEEIRRDLGLLFSTPPPIIPTPKNNTPHPTQPHPKNPPRPPGYNPNPPRPNPNPNPVPPRPRR